MIRRAFEFALIALAWGAVALLFFNLLEAQEQIMREEYASH